jgi:hypothetical protein
MRLGLRRAAYGEPDAGIRHNTRWLPSAIKASKAEEDAIAGPVLIQHLEVLWPAAPESKHKRKSLRRV